MGIVFLIIIGAAAGFIATRLMDIEASVPATIAIGVLGALVGGMLLRFLVTVGSVAFGLIGAIVGAVALIWIWQTYFK